MEQVEGDEAGHQEPGEGQGQPIPGRHPRLQEIGAPGAYRETSGQGRQQPATGPQSPPGPGRDYVPQRLEGRQGRARGLSGKSTMTKLAIDRNSLVRESRRRAQLRPEGAPENLFPCIGT